MRYKIDIRFRDGHIEKWEADGYSTSDCVLQLFTHTPYPMKGVKIFPLVDISNIDMEDKSA